MINKTLILGRRDIEALVDIKESIRAVESVFKEYGRGKTLMPPKIYLNLEKYSGDFRAMPSYAKGVDKAAIKWVNVHPLNYKVGLPTVMAVMILSDPKNGLPLCIMEGGLATNLRTGAAGAVAAKYLARKNSETVGFVGCGAQAKTQLEGLMEFFDIKEIKVWGKDERCLEDFVRYAKRLGIASTRAKDVRDCVCGCDILVTTTPSRKPLVRLQWLKKGVHINAIGADAKGKEELDPAILKHAKVVVDSWEQASHSGEINVPFKKGMISRKDIYADIGQIVTGKKEARTNPREITVFDSTGLAIQDVAMAGMIYKKAIRKKAGRFVELFMALIIMGMMAISQGVAFAGDNAGMPDKPSKEEIAPAVSIKTDEEEIKKEKSKRQREEMQAELDRLHDETWDDRRDHTKQ